MYASAVVMSNNNNSSGNSLSEEAVSTVSSVTRVHHQDFFNHPLMAISTHEAPPNPHQTIKKKRNLPGNPDPDAEVIALSPKTLMATNRFVCEICNKGFQRDQNLQLHRRGHNLPWKLKQRNSKDQMRKRAYVCPEPTCVHHHPSRALGDLTGIKKHFCRKHGEKKWKCEKCEKIYAVQSDWKAHSKTCGTREYRCDCGTLFSRKDSFITHRAFCDALAEESARLSAAAAAAAAAAASVTVASTATHPTLNNNITTTPFNININNPQPPHLFPDFPIRPWVDPTTNTTPIIIKPEIITTNPPPPSPLASPLFYENATVLPGPQFVSSATSAHLSATALLQKAATVGSTQSTTMMGGGDLATWQKTESLTRDFLGLTGGDHQYGHHHHHHHGGIGGGNAGGADVSVNVRSLLTYTGGVELPTYDRDHSLMKPHGFGFSEPAAEGHCYH